MNVNAHLVAVRLRYLCTANQHLEARTILQENIAVCQGILFGSRDSTENKLACMTMVINNYVDSLITAQSPECSPTFIQ